MLLLCLWSVVGDVVVVGFFIGCVWGDVEI